MLRQVGVIVLGLACHTHMERGNKGKANEWLRKEPESKASRAKDGNEGGWITACWRERMVAGGGRARTHTHTGRRETKAGETEG